MNWVDSGVVREDKAVKVENAEVDAYLVGKEEAMMARVDSEVLGKEQGQ